MAEVTPIRIIYLTDLSVRSEIHKNCVVLKIFRESLQEPSFEYESVIKTLWKDIYLFYYYTPQLAKKHTNILLLFNKFKPIHSHEGIK